MRFGRIQWRHAGRGVLAPLAMWAFAASFAWAAGQAPGGGTVVNRPAPPEAPMKRGVSVRISTAGGAEILDSRKFIVGGTPGAAASQPSIGWKQAINVTPTPEKFVLTNTGTEPLGIQSVVATSAFTESDNCVSQSPLAVGATCTVSVSAALTQLCQLAGGSVTVNDDAGSQTVSLTVYGADGTLNVTDLNSGTLTAQNLVNSMLGPGVNASNIEFTGAPNAAGTFTGGTDVLGINSGIILSDGSARNVIGPNCSTGITSDNGQPGDSDLTTLAGVNTNDAAVLQFDFIPDSDTLSIEYVWASDEYPEYVYSFNDVFGFFVNGTNIALVPGTDLPVTINDVNGGNPIGTNPANPQFYLNNNFQYPLAAPYDTEMDGLTVVLSAQGSVNPGVVNHIKLGVADAEDFVYDSNVFIKAQSITSSQITLSPGTLGFGTNTTTPQSVTVTNTGITAVEINSIGTTGVFTAQNVNCPIAPSSLGAGDSCTINVTFLGEGTGLQNGGLVVTDNANGVAGSTQTVTLSGTGTGGTGTPAASTSVSSLSFQHNLNLTCPTKPVILQNTGNAPLLIQGINVSGQFSESNSCPASLAPGATCEIDVGFISPGPPGKYTGALTITDNAAGSPQAIALNGQVYPPCLMQSTDPAQVLLRSTPSVTFNVTDTTPSCHTSTVTMACSNVRPATCSFTPSTIQPGGSTVLTVTGLDSLSGDNLSFTAQGTDVTNTTSVNLSVNFTDFSFSTYPTSAAVAPGQTANYAMTLTPINGLSGTIQLSCSGAPTGTQCSVTPSSVTLGQNYPAQTSVTVTTAGTSLAAPRGGVPLNGPGASVRWWLAMASLLAALGLVGWAAGVRRYGLSPAPNRVRRLGFSVVVLSALALMLLAWAACGSSGNMMNNAVSTPGTPAGTYSLTVKGTYNSVSGAATGLTHTQSLTLQVN